MSSTHRHLLPDFLWQVLSGPPCIIFTSENHLNAHSSLIKQHMAMNFAPLNCPCQGASSEWKKIYLDFFISEKIAKNQKIHILAPTAKNGFNGRNFYYTWIQLTLYNNWQQFGSNRRKNFFEKNHVLLYNFHFGKSFKRP
jgi:hypothetical protein